MTKAFLSWLSRLAKADLSPFSISSKRAEQLSVAVHKRLQYWAVLLLRQLLLGQLHPSLQSSHIPQELVQWNYKINSKKSSDGTFVKCICEEIPPFIWLVGWWDWSMITKRCLVQEMQLRVKWLQVRVLLPDELNDEVQQCLLPVCGFGFKQLKEVGRN